MMPLISVIIPTYNRAELLRETLKSVFAQSFRDFEVVVVDDGSTDQTEGMLCEFGNVIRSIRQKNKGPGAARDTGVQAAHGVYIAFLDSDDLWFPWTLEIYAKLLCEKSGVDIIFGKVARFTTPRELDAQAVTPLQASDYEDFLAAGQRPVFFGSNVVVKRAVLLSVGSLDREIRVFEDQDLGLRLGIGASCSVVESPVTVGYRQTPGSLTALTKRALEGICLLIENERSGVYPGGVRRRWERRNYISFSIRSVSSGLVQEGMLREAWALYQSSFSWHIRLGRLRYLVGFPLLLVWSLAGRIYRN